MASYSRYLIEFLFNYWSIEEMYLWYNQLFLSQLLSRPGGKFWEIFLKKNTVTTAYNQNVIVVYTVFEKYFQPLWIWLPSGLVGCSTDWKPLLENSCSICSCRRTSACHFQTPFETNCKEKRLCKMMIKKRSLKLLLHQHNFPWDRYIVYLIELFLYSSTLTQKRPQGLAVRQGKIAINHSVER